MGAVTTRGAVFGPSGHYPKLVMENMAMVYPLVNIQKAIKNGPVEIVSFPIDSMVIFHSYVNVYQAR